MLILAIDTSTIAASVAILDENKLHGQMYTDYKLKHSEKLLPMVDDLLRHLRFELSDIDCFAVGSGPGSFTGLRIGASTVKGFAHALNKSVIGVSTLEALACSVSHYKGTICPILDAQKDAVYTAVFTSNQGIITRRTEDMALSLKELITSLEGEYEVMFLGDAVLKFRDDIIQKMGDRAVFAPSSLLMPNACWVGEVALKKAQSGEFDNYNTFLPNYIRTVQIDKKKTQ